MADTTFHSIKLPGLDAARVPSMAEEFTTGTNYQVKDYCTYQGKLYRCTTAHSAGAWNASHFVETDLDTEFDRKLDIPLNQTSAPSNPRVGDLWIDSDENSPIYNIDPQPILGSTNAVQSGGTKAALNALDERKMEHRIITGDFSESVDYRVGDLVFHVPTSGNEITSRLLYRCIVDHNSTSWNDAHFTPTTLEIELQRVKDSESDIDMIGDLFGSKSIYNVGDYCIYNTNLYKCIQAVNNTGVIKPAFDPDDWAQVKLANDVSNLNSAIDQMDANSVVYESFTNTGTYTISVDDLESGQWSYSRKDDNVARARTKFLIPVYAGMIITYKNTTFDTFFGVLATQTSMTYLPGLSGWKTDGNGVFKITADGYLTFVIRNHADTSATVNPTNYNSVIILKASSLIQAKASTDTLQYIAGSLNSGNPRVLVPQWESGAYNSSGEVDYLSAIRTKLIPVIENSVITIDGIDDVISAGVFKTMYVYLLDASLNLITVQTPFVSGSNVRPNIPVKDNAVYVRFVLHATSAVTDDSSKGLLKITNRSLVMDWTVKDEQHGVKELDVTWFDYMFYARRNDESIPNFYTSPDGKTTALYPIPETGFRIYCTDDFATVINFFYLVDGNIVRATDYEAYVDNPTQYRKIDAFYPYKSGVYFAVQTGIVWNSDCFHVVAGTITGNGGRLPNLQACNLCGRRKDNSNAKTDQYFDVFSHWGYVRENPDANWYTGLNGGFSSVYCSILPLRAVKSVTVAPPFGIVARVYKIDNDSKTATIDREIFGNVVFASGNNLHRMISGVHHIDFDEFDYEGIILLGIVAPIRLVNGTKTMETMGMLGKYDDVYNSVFVQWKSGVNVSYDSGIPAICKKNIDSVKHLTSFVDLQPTDSDGGYGNWNQESANSIGIAYGRCAGWWYNGGNMCNGPHMHVNPKSYITASKNKHSRVYVPSHPSASYTKTGNLYGTVCSSTASLVCGFQIGSETFSYCSEFVDNFEYRELNGIESLRPGDLLACGTFMPDEEAEKGSYGHVVFITEKVSINGEVWCVNTFEGSQPWIQCRTLINYGAYPGYASSRVHEDNINDIDIFDYYSYQSYVARYIYHKIARPYPSILHTFRDAYGPYDVQDYPVTAIMCDRGTDAVYCVGEYMTLTVTDGTTSINLYKNGSFVRTVDLSAYSNVTYDDGIVYNVTGMFNSAGYYQIEKNGAIMESWFVPVERYMNASSNASEGIITLKFDPSEENDTVVAVQIMYWNDDDGVGRPVYDWQNIDDVTVDANGYCTYIGEYAPDFCDHVRRTPISVGVVRRTPYGTYQVCRYLYASAEYRLRQRAGLMLGAADG